MDDTPNNIFHTLNAINQTTESGSTAPEGFREFYNLLPSGVHNEIQSSIFYFAQQWDNKSEERMNWEGRKKGGILGLPYRAAQLGSKGDEMIPVYSEGAAILELGARMLTTARLMEEKLSTGGIGIDEYRNLRTTCGGPVFEVFQQMSNYINMGIDKRNFGKMAEAAINAAETIVVQHFNYSHSTEIFRFLEDLRDVIQTHFATSSEVNGTSESNGSL
jgi:hypothetical protein